MTQEPVSPLRRRMIEDMSMRQFGTKTQSDYVRVVRQFAVFIGRSPDLAAPEDLRRYQLHLAVEGASPSKMNAAVAALRFFFKVTLGKAEFNQRLARVRTPDRLPVVLSPEEVALLLHCAPSLKYKAALSVAYGCGLRISEIVQPVRLSPAALQDFLLQGEEIVEACQTPAEQIRNRLKAEAELLEN